MPAPVGLSTLSVPSLAPTRSASPLRPEPDADRRAADPVVADLDDQVVALADDADHGVRWPAAYLATLVSASATVK